MLLISPYSSTMEWKKVNYNRQPLKWWLCVNAPWDYNPDIHSVLKTQFLELKCSLKWGFRLWFVQQVLAHEDSQSNPQSADELSKVIFQNVLLFPTSCRNLFHDPVKIHHEIWRDEHPRHQMLIAGIGSWIVIFHIFHFYVCGWVSSKWNIITFLIN